MTRALLRWAASWLGFVILFCGAAGAARADTPLALFKSLAGNLNFTGTQVTMRTKNNNQPCSVASSSDVLSATLAGIPSGATVVSAQLYWAGSNSQSQADYSVVFDGKQVDAPASRQYFSASIGSGYDYFSGAADVTAQVAAKGNGSYTFSGLTISNGNPWCATEGVLGGYSLLVVYSRAAEPLRVLNLYEGFQYFRYSGITLNLSNFKVPKALDDTITARLAHITWEGDSTLNQDGEELLFNGAEMTDRLNPSGNQFNSASNINGDSRSWGIDFDAYTIAPSSGLVTPGQTSATTRYQSGQDLVLLNAEVIAIPNVPAADLSLAMARGAPLQVGTDTAYTLTVSSAGPSTEPGPVTVTASLPSGMGLTSAGGSGWSCTVGGQTITCNGAGPLAPGAALAPLTLVLRPAAPGTYALMAGVAGQTFDNVAANNTATDTATASAVGTAWAFTSAPCAAGAALGSAACPAFAGPVTAGAAAPAWITSVSGNPAVATVLNTSADTTVQMRFALSCVDPIKPRGVAASFAGAALPLCAESGATPAAGSAYWSAQVALVVPKNAASAPAGAGFAYADVGRVTLFLLDPANRSAAATFVSKPSSLAFQAVRRTSDGAPNPAPTGGARPGFVRAGEAFTLVVGARTANGQWAPNFGYELDGRWWPQIRLQQVQERELPAVQGAFESASNGLVTGTGFWWDEAGTVNLAPVLNDYLNAGGVGGDALDVGRFYPDHFTTATYPAFPCMAGMACPPGTITGAAYSAQPFRVDVSAVGLTGKALANYSGVAVTLAAIDVPGGSNQNPRGGTLAYNSAVTGVGIPAATANPAYLLPSMFSWLQPRALNWTAPTAIWLRATAPESVVDASGTARSVTISSKLATAAASALSEGGAMVVNGRLLLSNAFGSELLRLPVRMNAQFWTGSAWANNSRDNASQVDYAGAGGLVFSECTGALASGSGAANCNTQLLAVPPAPPLPLKDGAGGFALPAPRKTGSAWLRVGDGHPAWLPSTRARANFGLYKSAFIFTREVH